MRFSTYPPIPIWEGNNMYCFKVGQELPHLEVIKGFD